MYAGFSEKFAKQDSYFKTKYRFFYLLFISYEIFNRLISKIVCNSVR